MASDLDKWNAYLYPGTDVLINKFDIQDQKQLQAKEYAITSQRATEFNNAGISVSKDFEGLKSVHHQIFQDVYTWAGEARNVNIAKAGSSFEPADNIEAKAKEIFSKLESDNYLKGLDKKEFVEKFTDLYVDTNKLHPFREGNGRSTREFIGQIANEAGYSLDQTRIDNSKNEWNKAAAASMNKDGPDNSGLKAIFNEAIRPTRAIDFEKLPANEAIAKHPELAGTIERLDAKREQLAAQYPGNEAAQKHFAEQYKTELVRQLDTGKVHEPSRQVEYTVNTVNGDSQKFSSAQEAAKAFVNAKAEDRPSVIRSEIRPDGREVAATVATTSVVVRDGKSEFGKGVSEHDPVFKAAHVSEVQNLDRKQGSPELAKETPALSANVVMRDIGELKRHFKGEVVEANDQRIVLRLGERAAVSYPPGSLDKQVQVGDKIGIEFGKDGGHKVHDLGEKQISPKGIER